MFAQQFLNGPLFCFTVELPTLEEYFSQEESFVSAAYLLLVTL